MRTAQQGEPGTRDPGGEVRQEIYVARQLRARSLVSGRTPAEIAAVIHEECAPAFGTTWIRAHRLALGIALADVVAQIRARYEAEGRTAPRFSETLLSAYESAQKRPGPEYLHYLCAVYQADPRDLGYQDPCFCGRQHRSPLISPPASPLISPPASPVPASPQAPAESVVSLVEGTLRTGPAGSPAGWQALSRGAAAEAGPRGPAARRLSAVPEPRNGEDLAGLALPSAWAAASGGGPAAPVALAPTSAPGAGAPAGCEDDDDVLRRAMLRLMADAGPPVDGRFFAAVDRIRRRMDGALLRASVSVTMLDQWEDTVRGYGRQYRSAAPLRLLCDLLLDLGDVRRVCEERQPVEFVERLCQLAAKLAGLSAMTMINMGDQRQARSFFRTARIAADETGNRQLRGWVAVRESLVPLYYGDPGQAMLLARMGADLAGRHVCVASVMAPVVEARALARLASAGYGSVRETLAGAKAAADRARLALEELPAPARGDTAFGYTERQLLFHLGDALVHLRDHKAAQEAFERALRMYSPAEILDRSLIMLGQASCLLQAGEPTEALRLGRETVLALPGEHRTGLVVRAARSLGESVAAAHGDLPAVRDYRAVLSAVESGLA
jgi:tetratricopeptide (TPR) repeat protein